MQPEIFRQVHGVEKILKQLSHYTFIRTDDPRLVHTSEDIVVLRSVICMSVETLLSSAANDITESEVEAIVDYVERNSEVDIVDCVQSLVRVMLNSSRVAEIFAENHSGVKMFSRL